MSTNTIDRLKDKFCKYSITAKIFEESSYPPAIWDVFHQMRESSMTLFQIAEALSVKSDEIEDFIETLVKQGALEKHVKNIDYTEWKNSYCNELSPTTDILNSPEEFVAVDIMPESKDSTVITFDIS